MTNWKGKAVLIIGAARQGTALARYLVRHGARVVLNDNRPEKELEAVQHSMGGLQVEWVFGGHPLSLLDGIDLVCPSGGVPLTLPIIEEALRRGTPLSNDSQIFLEAVPCAVIGITGSAGKTTTTTLVGRMAQFATEKPGTKYARCWIGGNIGNPLIASVDDMQAGDLAVMELSSFQLEIMTQSPNISVLLNVTPNHLDRHRTMAAYTAAKANILRFQKPADTAVLGRDDQGAWSLASQVVGKLATFGRDFILEDADRFLGLDVFVRGNNLILRDEFNEIPIMSVSDIRLKGAHNLMNVLAACATCAAAGLPVEAMRQGVEGFRGVPHRLEFIRTWHEADWYNDSIATAPERAIAALKAFDRPLVLLAGGRDKNLPWDDFASLICKKVDHLIAFGETAEMIARLVKDKSNGTRPHSIRTCQSMFDAVQEAAKVLKPGDVVLLSPGGTSFDEFRDFEDRGEQYKKWLMALD